MAVSSSRRAPPGPLETGHADEVIVALSDIEIGAGGPTDDFPQSAWLGELILRYCEGAFADVPVTLVLNGDTLDLLKTSIDGAWPTHIDASIGLAKLARIAPVHRAFFAALAEFAAHKRARRHIAFVLGNHDPELCLPEVQGAVRALCGGASEEALSFPGLSLRIGDVHIEHGCQADPLFTFDPNALTLEHEGRRLLNLPWGSVALLEVAIPLTPVLYHHDRLKPRDQLLELLPELKRLLIGAFWRYWTRDYWQHYLAAQDPLRRLSWTMLREIAYRFAAGAMDVNLGDTYQRLVKADDQVRVCIVGHAHEPAWYSAGPKKLLQTGCFRNEFAILEGGRRQELLPKVYAEVYMRRGRAIRSHLVEIDAPAPPAGYIPDSLFAVGEELRKLLEQRNLAGDAERAAREHQEAQEAEAADAARKREDSPWSHRFDFLHTLQRALSSAPNKP